MIIAVNGLIGAGKDEFAKVLQYQFYKQGFPIKGYEHITPLDYQEFAGPNYQYRELPLEIRKFADALKDITCRMLGCTRAQLEDRDFKNSFLPEEWWYFMGISKKMLTYTPKLLEHIGPGGVYELIKPTYREFLQKLGTEAIRNQIHPNAHVNMLMREYLPLPVSDYDSTHWQGHAISFPEEKEQYPDWVITDCRFPNEAQAVRDRGGIVVEISRHAEEDNKPKHESETALAGFPFDAFIHNTGSLEDLVRIGGDFVNHFNLYKYANTNTSIVQEGSVRTFTPGEPAHR